MKRFTLFALFTLATIFPVRAQNTMAKFRYQPDKIAIGTVYHYVKTNFDGTHPEQVSIYVSAKDRIESFKFHPGGGRAGLVVAQLDWALFIVKRLESWQVFANDERKLFATLDYDNVAKSVRVEIPPMGKPAETVEIKHLPFHVYNFDLASLNFAFRHLRDPQGSFVIGIADPTFANEGPVFRYKGEAEVSYVGEEKRNNVPCRKYKIDGEGLENRGGFIWVNKGQGHFEDMEVDLPDNPDWQNFKFRLKSVEEMDRQAWEKFMQAQFGENRNGQKG